MIVLSVKPSDKVIVVSDIVLLYVHVIYVSYLITNLGKDLPWWGKSGKCIYFIFKIHHVSRALIKMLNVIKARCATWWQKVYFSFSVILWCCFRLFVEKLPAHPEYAKAAPVDKATNKKVKPNRKRTVISWPNKKPEED